MCYAKATDPTAIKESNAPTDLCWPVSPSHGEVELTKGFLKAQSELIRKEKRETKAVACECAGIDPAEAAAWVDFSLALLNCNEFLYVP